MRRLLAVCAVLALSACISDTVTVPGRAATGGVGSTSGIAGTYTLTTMAGAPLPYTFLQSGTDSYQLVDDVITLTSGGSWSESWHERRSIGGVVNVVALTDAGTYTQAAGGVVTFLSPSHAGFDGTYDGNNMLTLTGLSPTGQPVPQIFNK